LGGVSLYLLGLVAFRYRHVRTINRRRLGLALLFLALIPVGHVLPALATVAMIAVLLAATITFDTISYGPGRARIRHELA
jgi:hypothetical protein